MNTDVNIHNKILNDIIQIYIKNQVHHKIDYFRSVQLFYFFTINSFNLLDLKNKHESHTIITIGKEKGLPS